VAGTGIILDPSNGDGVVTITATGGGAGGEVDSITSGGTGLGVSNPTGAVVLTNTGVTSIVAGTGITASGSIGAVTLTAVYPAVSTTGLGGGSLGLTISGDRNAPTVISTDAALLMNIPVLAGSGNLCYVGYITNASWGFSNRLAFGAPYFNLLEPVTVPTYGVASVAITRPGSAGNLWRIVVTATANTTLATFPISMISFAANVTVA
jgi:hypothetical protein